jgi:hypothetical protein
LVDPGDQVELTDEQLGDSRSRRYQTLADLQQADGELVKVLAARRLGVLGERTLVRN